MKVVLHDGHTRKAAETLGVRGICNSLVVLGSGAAFFPIDLKVVVDTPRVGLSSRVRMNFGKVAIERRFRLVSVGAERTAVREAKAHGLGAHVAAIDVGVTGEIAFAPTRPVGRLIQRRDRLGLRRLRRVAGRLGAVIAGRYGRVAASQARGPRGRRREQRGDLAATVAVVALAQRVGSQIGGNDIGTSGHAAFARHVRHFAAVYGSRCRGRRSCHGRSLGRG